MIFKHIGDDKNITYIKERIKEKNYDQLLVLTSDYFVKRIKHMLEEMGSDANFAFSNNCHLCCGEGICGACAYTDENGDTYKMCKCQVED